MNEQIQNILNENGTKTSKIQKLLTLGLTRRQVADLVAGGNYGFVQNVYKRMMQGMTQSAAQAASTVLPQLDYTFNRNFGIEIEAYNCTRERLARELTAAGIRVEVESYNHTDHTDHWKLVTDSSLSGNNTFELVSPILHGEQGLEELEKVCWVLDLCNAKVNDSCGLHVHMDAAEFDLQTWKNLVITYKRLENVIDHFMPRSRRNNTFCLPPFQRQSSTKLLILVSLEQLLITIATTRLTSRLTHATARWSFASTEVQRISQRCLLGFIFSQK